MFKLLLRYRSNLVIQFSAASLVMMVALAATIAFVYTNRLGESIELLSMHETVMHSGNIIRPSDPFSIPSLRSDVDTLRWLSLATITIGFAILYASLVAIVWRAWVTIKSQRKALYERVQELENASVEITQLQGLVPICSHCKSVRDDSGYWSRIETYISRRTDAEFSHSVCPPCLKTHYPEFTERLTVQFPTAAYDSMAR